MSEIQLLTADLVNTKHQLGQSNLEVQRIRQSAGTSTSMTSCLFCIPTFVVAILRLAIEQHGLGFFTVVEQRVAELEAHHMATQERAQAA